MTDSNTKTESALGKTQRTSLWTAPIGGFLQSDSRHNAVLSDIQRGTGMVQRVPASRAWLKLLMVALSASMGLFACGGDDGGNNNGNGMGTPDVVEDADDGDDVPNNSPNNDMPEDVVEDMVEDESEQDVEDDSGEDDVDDIEDAEEDVGEDAPSEDDIEEDVEPPGECSLDEPCDEGQCNLDTGVCEDRSPCFGPLDCLGGELGDRVCAGCAEGNCGQQGGVCRDRCDDSSDCPEGELCIDGGCGIYPDFECSGDADCPGAQICDVQAYACVDAPSCQSDEDCRGERRCDSNTNACVECVGESDCDGLQVCERGDFVGLCREPVDCLQDLDCLGLRVCDPNESRCLNPVCEEDRFEPNNRVNENIARLGEGVYTGLRVCGGEADLFLVTPPMGQPLSVTLRAEGGPVQAFVYEGGADPFGAQQAEPLQESTGSGDARGILMPGVDQPVTYLLHVTSPVEGIKSYQMRVSFDPPEFVEPPCAPDEDGVDQDTAVTVVPGNPLSGEVCNEGVNDEDWFSIRPLDGQAQELSLVYDTEGDELLMDFFQVEDGELVPLGIASQPRELGKVAIIEPTENPAPILVRVQSFALEARNNYLLSLISIDFCPQDDQEPNNSTLQPSVIDIDPRQGTASVEALTVCLNDSDYYRVTVAGNRGVVVSASVAEGGQGTTPNLALLERTGDNELVPVGRLSVVADATTVSLGRTPERGATYFVEVQATSDGVSDYELNVEIFDEPFCELNDPLEPSDAQNVVPLQSTNQGAFLCADEEDWYRVTVANGEEVDVSISGVEGARFDLLRMPGMTVEAEDVEGRLLTTINQGGQFAIRVEGADAAVEGNYTLASNVTADPPANEVCSGAATLLPGEVQRGTLRSARDAISTDDFACFALEGSPDVVYVLDVQQASDSTIAVTPVPDGILTPIQPTVFLVADCLDSGSIIDGLCASDFDDLNPNDGTVTLQSRLAPGTYFLWIDGGTEGSIGDFDVLWDVE